MLQITVAIATLASRVENLSEMDMPQIEGVDYHIFLQDAGEPHEIPITLKRADITVEKLSGRGVAKSRNKAIQLVKGDIIVFADDDLVLHTHNYDRLRNAFEKTPQLSFVCGRLLDCSGQTMKTYSADGTAASRLNTGKVGTPEIAIRVERFHAQQVRFDPEFGAGTPKWLGDEFIFLCDAIKAGLIGQHVALTFATHPRYSSGDARSADSFEVREMVLRRAFGPISWPFRCAFAWRNRKRFPSIISFVRFFKF